MLLRQGMKGGRSANGTYCYAIAHLLSALCIAFSAAAPYHPPRGAPERG